LNLEKDGLIVKESNEIDQDIDEGIDKNGPIISDRTKHMPQFLTTKIKKKETKKITFN